MSRYFAICQNIWENSKIQKIKGNVYKHGIPDSFLKSKEKIYIWLENHVNINIITFPKKKVEIVLDELRLANIFKI